MRIVIALVIALIFIGGLFFKEQPRYKLHIKRHHGSELIIWPVNSHYFYSTGGDTAKLMLKVKTPENEYDFERVYYTRMSDLERPSY